jgi:hypothetical protein
MTQPEGTKLTDEDIETLRGGDRPLKAEARDLDQVDPDTTDGTDSQDADGTDTQDADGTDTQDADGTDTKDADGTDTKDADGTDTKDADGTDSGDGVDRIDKSDTPGEDAPASIA